MCVRVLKIQQEREFASSMHIIKYGQQWNGLFASCLNTVRKLSFSVNCFASFRFIFLMITIMLIAACGQIWRILHGQINEICS